MSTAREQLIAELVAERFGPKPAWSERTRKPPARPIDDDITTARRRRELLNLAEDAPDDHGRRGRNGGQQAAPIRSLSA